MYEIYSGVKDPMKFGQVVSWGGMDKLEWWKGPECNKILGSDGVSMPPFVTPDRVFHMFVPGICRSLKFTFDSEVNVLGIPGYRFTVPEDVLGDPREVPENRCYCSGFPDPEEQKRMLFMDDDADSDEDEDEDGDAAQGRAAVEDLKYLETCPKEGVWELSSCRKGSQSL
jgi:hypothetical protein